MKNKQNLAILLFIAFLLASCAKRETGQLIGVLDRPTWIRVQVVPKMTLPTETPRFWFGTACILRGC